VAFCMHTDYKHLYGLCMKQVAVYKLAFTNMATFRNFEVISHKFNVDRICAKVRSSKRLHNNNNNNL
jgi:hypothetical protein